MEESRSSFSRPERLRERRRSEAATVQFAPQRVLPARRRALEHAEHYSREMQLNLLIPLEARQELARAEGERLRAAAALRAGLVELERAVGELLSPPLR